jgi:hypothetical protein
MYQGFLTAQDEVVIVSTATSPYSEDCFQRTPAPSCVKNLAIHLHSSRRSCMFSFAGNDSGQGFEEQQLLKPPDHPNLSVVSRDDWVHFIRSLCIT